MLVFLGILIEIAWPRWAAWSDRQAVAAAARTFRTDLQRARAAAILRGETIAVELDTLAASYEARSLRGGQRLFGRRLGEGLFLRTTAYRERILFTARGTGSLYSTTWIGAHDRRDARWHGTRVTPTGAIEAR